MCKRFLVLSAVSAASVIMSALCFGVSASADLNGGRYMTPSEALEVFGSEITFQYYNGTGYKEATFRYDSTCSYTANDSVSDSYLSQNATFLRYTSDPILPSYSPEYITLDISPSYSIFDTEYIYSCIALSRTANVSQVYQSPSWDWMIGGSQYHFENTPDTDSGIQSEISIQGALCTFVTCDYSGTAATSGYSQRAVFCGNHCMSSGKYYLYIGCPYISADASGAYGTHEITSGGNSGSSGGNVDMTETNGILGRIWSAITSLPETIIDGIASIFVPEEGYMDEQLAAIQEHFAWYEEIKKAGDIFKTAFDANSFSENPVVIITTNAHSNWTGENYWNNDGLFVLDMNDFAPYRGTVQNIISIFLWLFLFWRLFARLPDIIHGAGMATHDVFKIENHMSEKSSDSAQDVVDNTFTDSLFDLDGGDDLW